MKSRATEIGYIQFLLASPKVYSCTEASRVQPASEPISHDSWTRMLSRLELGPESLWHEVQDRLDRHRGLLVVDDSTLDKPYARKMELVSWHWSGKHHRAVQGMNIVTLLWTDGDRHIPVDYAIYDKKNDGQSKNDLFRSMLQRAHERGFTPQCVCFDSWYASCANLKLLDKLGYRWLTRLKSNRQVNPDGNGNQALKEVSIPDSGRKLHVRGYGWARVFRTADQDDCAHYWATSDLDMDDLERVKWAQYAWRIEEYHRGIKQHCGVERCQARSARAQRNHIGLALRAFVRLEQHCSRSGISWFEAKQRVIRSAVTAYLQHPLYAL